jgi:hypothetical protein
MTRSRQTADWGSRAGLAKIVPSSVAVGSGTGSADSLGNVSFTGASSISVNGCFISTYKNYRVLISLSSSPANGNLNMRLRKAGTDATASDYTFGGWLVTSQGSTATQTGNFIGQWTILRVSNDADTRFNVSLDFFNPQVNAKTSFNSIGFGNESTPEMHLRGGYHNVVDTFDAFTISHSGGNIISGTIQIYGYTN